MNLDDLSALLGEDVSAGAHSDLWVVAPAGEAGERLVAEARRLADGLGCYVQALTASEDAAQGLIAAGANHVHVTAEAVQYLASQQPEFVLYDSTDSLAAAHYAQRAGAGLITEARDLRVEEDTRALVGTHAVYAGEYAHVLAITTPVKVATVASGDLPAPHPDARRSGEVLVDEAEPPTPTVRDIGPATYVPPDWRPLSKARVIVAAGRGVRDEEGVALARQLAETIGAELAGDRSALASGWIDDAHEVDVTGQEVAPDLYLAIGILGDTMHNAAIAGARRVIAVHPNAQAPIFSAADVAVVAEPKAWVKLVLAALVEGWGGGGGGAPRPDNPVPQRQPRQGQVNSPAKGGIVLSPAWLLLYNGALCLASSAPSLASWSSPTWASTPPSGCGWWSMAGWRRRPRLAVMRHRARPRARSQAPPSRRRWRPWPRPLRRAGRRPR